ncbi:MAG: hypothetical protein ACRD25_04655 [Terracidiphilus sp.]
MPTPEQLHTELWRSLAALLRSYTTAHGLNRNQSATIHSDDDCLTARHGSRWLELRRRGPCIGWTRENGERGVLEMTEEGRLRGPASEEELDTTAEAWARELML